MAENNECLVENKWANSSPEERVVSEGSEGTMEPTMLEMSAAATTESTAMAEATAPSEPSATMEASEDNTKNEQEEKVQEEALGRNRRVRQKNRYFLDFHCSNLTKGSRGKDEFDAYAAATGGGGGSATRSSTRRSTTDSTRSTSAQGSQAEDNEAPLFVTKYCRSCYGKTPHEVETGCQACLYREIVRVQKRQKSSSSRSRPSSNQHKQQQQQQHQPDQQQQQQPQPQQQQANQQQKQPAPIEQQKQDPQPKQLQQEPQIQQAQPQTVQSKKSKDSGDSDNVVKSSKNTGIPKLVATTNGDSGNSSGQKRKWVVKQSRSPNAENVISIRREIEPDSKPIDSADDKSSTLTTNDENKIEKNNIKNSSNNNNNNNNTNNNTNDNISDSNDHSEIQASKKVKICDTKASNNNNPASNITTTTSTTTTATTAPTTISEQSAEISRNNLDLTHLDKWTPEQVASYVSSKGFETEADSFKAQAVDGFSLLLMQRTDFTYGLKMKLGPALKLYNQVCKLKDEYFRQIAAPIA